MIGSVLAVFVFEWKRALTLPRMAWWGLLAGFPVFIIGLIRFTIEASTDEKPPRELWVGFLYALIPMLVSMLGTFLWTTPAISSELERRSWVYLAVRPHGATAVMLGKYLAAVTWVLPPALVGLSAAVYLIHLGQSPTESQLVATAADRFDSWQTWWAIARLVCLSCPAYGAIYLLLGTIMPRRGMVLAVAYTLLFELVVGLIPAVINKFTVQYRLRALLIDWCDLEFPSETQADVISLFGDAPAWQHVAVLVALVPCLLAVSVAVVRWSEFSSAAESDV